MFVRFAVYVSFDIEEVEIVFIIVNYIHEIVKYYNYTVVSLFFSEYIDK